MVRACALSAILSIFVSCRSVDAQDHSPQLLLTQKRLKRLQRDRERQTVRWLNFETRINSVPDSSERGFELALYYAVTHDEKRGKEAIEWALAHKCAIRQIALILDWCGALASVDERQKLTSPSECPAMQAQGKAGIETLRDVLFMRIVRGEDVVDPVKGKELEQFGLTEPRHLYAACEYIEAVRETQRVDLREDDPAFFGTLPATFLLSMNPGDLENPIWQAPAAALALVSLDPNLESSQFLQGWAMEDRQMIREGPGVAYELLWGNPYLPGVSYRNLDSWSYDRGRLVARTNWDSNACWISISTRGVEEANCPAGWRQRREAFGRMTLIPMMGPCLDVYRTSARQATIIWRLQPHERVSYLNESRQVSSQADDAGLWLLPGYIEGKICTSANQK